MAMDALQLLRAQHREIERWFDQLAGLRGPSAAGTWPHEGPSRRASSDSGEEIREDRRTGLRIPGPHELVAVDDPARVATAVPSEQNGRTDDAVPGQAHRDMAGHWADGKTHVGTNDERFRAQMIDTEGRAWPDSMVGQARETRSAMAEQDTASAMRRRGGAHRGQPPGRDVVPGPLTETQLDHKRALLTRLCDLVLSHTLLEEHVLYPTARSLHAPWIPDALAAHRDLLALVSELRRTDAGHAHADALLGHLHGLWHDHVIDEEARLFAWLADRLDVSELEAMGARMQERARSLIGLERRFALHGVEGAAFAAPPAVVLSQLEEVRQLGAGDGSAGTSR